MARDTAGGGDGEASALSEPSPSLGKILLKMVGEGGGGAGANSQPGGGVPLCSRAPAARRAFVVTSSIMQLLCE
jgi:hypothetical protein